MKDLGTVTLETERLILRKLELEDAESAFNNWTNDSRVTKYLSWNSHKTVEDTKNIFSMWLKEYEEPFTFRWVVELKDTNELIGLIDVVSKRIGDKTAELGQCYGYKYWGKGYGTEALKKVIDFLLYEVGFDLIEAKHMSNNPASGKAMEKAGMKYDGTLRKRIIDKETKERIDFKVYSIMRED